MSGVGKSQTIHYKRGPFPPRLFCHYMYSFQNAAEGAVIPYVGPVLIGNGLYRPCQSATDSVAWFDQTQAYLYNYVHASRYTLHVEYRTPYLGDIGTPTLPNLVFVIFPTVVDPSLWVTYLPQTADQLAVWQAPYIKKVLKFETGNNRLTMSMFAKTKDLFALDELTPGFQGAFANTVLGSTPANPTNEWYWGMLVMADTFGSGDFTGWSQPSWSWRQEVEYFTECWTPVQQTNVLNEVNLLGT